MISGATRIRLRTVWILFVAAVQLLAASHNEAYDWLAVRLKHFARERGLPFTRALAKQDLTMMRGRTAQA